MHTEKLIIDSFAGGGGVSLGIEWATGRPVDIAINHDPAAIAMHRANHPHTRHYCEDIWQVDPVEATGGRPVGLFWLSPDCTHHSKARGGKPADKNIRGLAWVAIRWARAVRPDVIILENVEEFQGWGPLIDGRPDPARKGHTFKAFVNMLRRIGYKVDWRELRACNYGAPTIRKRFFLIARSDGRPIVWPEATHGDPQSLEVLSGMKKPWRTAADIIDWSIPCKSIFNRKKPLAENTMRRIAKGLKKFVFDNPNPFIIKVNHTGEVFRGQEINEPLQTITAKNGWGLVMPYITALGQTSTEDRSANIESPLGTIVSKQEHMVITPFLASYHSETSKNGARGQSIENPLHTIDASNRHALVTASFVSRQFGKSIGHSMDQPTGTVTAGGGGKSMLVTSHLIKFRGKNYGSSMDQPVHTITAGGMHIGEVRAFLLKYYGSDIGLACDEPLHTVTTKDRFGLVTVQGQDYEIIDIGMRMLEPRELFNAQGFPADYIIDVDDRGKPYPKAAQVARCGNSVPPPVVTALVQANLPELCVGVGRKIANVG